MIMDAALTMLVLVLVVPVSGGLMAATPYLMPKRECFAVTIPEAAQQDEQLRGYKRKFALWCAALTVLCTGIMAVAAAPVMGAPADSSSYGALVGTLIGSTLAVTLVPFCFMLYFRKKVMALKRERGWFAPRQEATALALVGTLIGSTLAVTLVPFCFMLYFRKKVMALKRERGWFAPRQEATALVAEDDVPHAISLAWNLLYIPVVLVIVAIGVVAYPSMPDMIPMHADFAGNVNDYEPKSIGVVFGFPVLTVLFLAVCFVFSHWMMIRSKRPTNPGAPVTSALAYGMFARAQSIFLLAAGLFLSIGIGVGFMLSSVGVFGLSEMALVIVLLSIFIVIGAVAISVVYGQAGSRLFSRMEAAGGEACMAMPADDDEHWKLGVFYYNPDDPSLVVYGQAGSRLFSRMEAAGGEACMAMPADDDEHWKLGVFYYNPDDPSLWLCERFGVGWTMNFARPAAWAFVVGFALVTIAFIVAITVMVG